MFFNPTRPLNTIKSRVTRLKEERWQDYSRVVAKYSHAPIANSELEPLRLPMAKKAKKDFPLLYSHTPFDTKFSTQDWFYRQTSYTYRDDDGLLQEAIHSTLTLKGTVSSDYRKRNAFQQWKFYCNLETIVKNIESELAQKKIDWKKINQLCAELQQTSPADSGICGNYKPAELHIDSDKVDLRNMLGLFKAMYLLLYGLLHVPTHLIDWFKGQPSYCSSARYFVDVLSYLIKAIAETCIYTIYWICSMLGLATAISLTPILMGAEHLFSKYETIASGIETFKKILSLSFSITFLDYFNSDNNHLFSPSKNMEPAKNIPEAIADIAMGVFFSIPAVLLWPLYLLIVPQLILLAATSLISYYKTGSGNIFETPIQNSLKSLEHYVDDRLKEMEVPPEEDTGSTLTLAR